MKKAPNEKLRKIKNVKSLILKLKVVINTAKVLRVFHAELH